MGRHKKRGPKRKPKRDYQRERAHMLANKLDPQNARPVGAPDPVANATSHGVVAFKNRMMRKARRGKSLIDRRTVAGQNAIAVRDEILADQGGAESLSAAKLVLVEMVARDVYFLDEVDRRIFKAIYKFSKREKVAEKLGRVKSPKLIGVLYGYRQGIARNLANNLVTLGLERQQKVKTLDEILSEEEEPSESKE
jgi:hypothetical protein